MIRKVEDQQTISRTPGKVLYTLAEPEEMYNVSRMYARISLAPGTQVDYHVHENDMESFYVAKGICRVDDNGEIGYMKEGDILITPHGCGHAVYNESDETVELIASIINIPQE